MRTLLCVSALVLVALSARAQPEPTDALSFAKRGGQRFKNGDTDLAFQDFTEALKLDPNCGLAHYGLGAVCTRKREYEKAIKHYDAHLALEPKSMWGLIERGVAYGQTGQSEKGLVDLDRAVELYPMATQPRLGRATIFISLKQYQKALDDGDTAIRLNREYPGGHLARGMALQRMGEHEKALASLSEAYKRDPKDRATLHTRIICFIATRDLKKALDDANDLVKLAPQDADSYHYRGTTHFESGTWGPALDDIKMALELNKDHSGALANRALIRAACPLAERRDGKVALAEAKRACELTNWKAAFQLEVYAAAHAESGDFALAVMWQREVLEHKEYMDQRGPDVRLRLKLYESKQAFRLPQRME